MKKDFSFLNKVIVFDNHGKTLNRYTIIFQDGSHVGSSKSPCSPNGFYMYRESVNYFGVGFDGPDGTVMHETDKDIIKRINKKNKHIGKYKTINAMKRLPQDMLDCIKEEVEDTQV